MAASASAKAGVALSAYALTVTIAAASVVIASGRQAAGQPIDPAAILLWQGLVYGLWIPAGWLLNRMLERTTSPFNFGLIGAMIVISVSHSLIAGALDAAFSRLPDLTLAEAAIDRAPIDMLTVTGLAAAISGWRWRSEAGRLQQALAQAREARAERASDAVEWIMVSVGRRRVPVDPTDVEWFAAAANYVVVNWDGREGLMRDTLQALEARLDPRLFARVHRSTLTNLAKVVEAAPAGGGLWRLTMLSGAHLIVSRTSRADILARLGRR